MADGLTVIGRFGPLTLHLFGITVAAGCVVGTVVAWMQARRFGVSGVKLFEVAAPALIAGVIGARVAYVIVNFSDYRPALASVWRWSEGGFSFYGGLAAGIIVAATYAPRLGLSVWRFLDAAAPGLAVAQAVGFVGAHLIGRETAVPWAIHVGDRTMHPFPAYGIIFAYALFFATWRLGARPKPVRPGRLFLVYMFLHGAGTVMVGTWAAGARYSGLTVGQWAGLVICVVAGVGLLLARYWFPAETNSHMTNSPIPRSHIPSRAVLMAATRRQTSFHPFVRGATWVAGLATLLTLFLSRM